MLAHLRRRLNQYRLDHASKTNQTNRSFHLFFPRPSHVSQRLRVNVATWQITQNSINFIINLKKLINNSRGKYKRNECLINVCKSDTDLS